MTIEEASELVIQASKLAMGGDLFVLNMGKPVKIIELAKQMINLSGLKYKSKNTPEGDIEIVYSGLRAGEKMFEELLINCDSISTEHSQIFKGNESFILKDKLLIKLNLLSKYIEKNEKDNIFKILKELVPEWKNEST